MKMKQESQRSRRTTANEDEAGQPIKNPKEDKAKRRR